MNPLQNTIKIRRPKKGKNGTKIILNSSTHLAFILHPFNGTILQPSYEVAFISLVRPTMKIKSVTITLLEP